MFLCLSVLPEMANKDVYVSAIRARVTSCDDWPRACSTRSIDLLVLHAPGGPIISINTSVTSVANLRRPTLVKQNTHTVFP